jgi:hypothetical protein
MKREHRTDLANDRNAPAMRLSNCFGDCQAHTRPLSLLAICCGPIELLEDEGQLDGIDSTALVCDVDRYSHFRVRDRLYAARAAQISIFSNTDFIDLRLK